MIAPTTMFIIMEPIPLKASATLMAKPVRSRNHIMMMLGTAMK
jgi:hypothetical protein